jgi:hypothetical protein
MKALTVAAVVKVIETTSARAVKTPPNAWPLITALMYSLENIPAMPKSPPDNIAEKMLTTKTTNIQKAKLKFERAKQHSNLILTCR